MRLISLISLFSMIFFLPNVVGSIFAQNAPGSTPGLTWSPPDGNFTIDVPVALEIQEIEFNDESQKHYKSTATFGARDGENVFMIVVLEPTDDKRAVSTKEKFAGMQFFIS